MEKQRGGASSPGRGGSVTGASQGTELCEHRFLVLKKKRGCELTCGHLSGVLSLAINATLQSRAIETQPGYRGGAVPRTLACPPQGTPGSAHGHGRGWAQELQPDGWWPVPSGQSKKVTTEQGSRAGRHAAVDTGRCPPARPRSARQRDDRAPGRTADRGEE